MKVNSLEKKDVELLRKEVELLRKEKEFLEREIELLKGEKQPLQREVDKLSEKKDILNEYLKEMRESYRKIGLPISICNALPEEFKRPILIWFFDDAPEEFRRMSTCGGDEDWVALIPPHYINVYFSELSFLTEIIKDSGENIKSYDFYDGSIIQIQSHA